MDQIGTTLDLIKSKMNQYFSNVQQSDEDWVSISNIVSQDGKLYNNAKNKIVIFLTNIQHETIISTYNKNVPAKNNSYVTVSPPIYINLYLLFYSNFYDANYRNGLRMISETISFFQQYACFTQDNLPGLDPSIDKLMFEMVNLEMTDLSYMLGLAGTKYLPSVLYKVRVFPYTSDFIQGQTAGVQGLQDQAAPLERPSEDELMEEKNA